MSKSDLWSLFKPKQIPMFEGILRVKRDRELGVKIPVWNYRVKEIVGEVLRRSVEF